MQNERKTQKRKPRGKPFEKGNKAAFKADAKHRRKRGRPKGSTRRVTQEAIEEAKKSGILPRDFLLQTMRNEKLDLSIRIDAAKGAAPYFHNRLSQIEHLSPPLDLSKLTLDELREFRRLRALADT
jgi:hypothetical protein